MMKRYTQSGRKGDAGACRHHLHNIAHWGNTVQLIAIGAISREGYMILRRHFRAVNKCRQIDFDRHSRRALAI